MADPKKPRVPLGRPLNDSAEVENYEITPDDIADAQAWAEGLNKPQSYIGEDDKMARVSPGFVKGLLNAKPPKSGKPGTQ